MCETLVIISNNGNLFSIKKESEIPINSFIQEFEINIDKSKIKILKLEDDTSIDFKFQKEDVTQSLSECLKISVSIELEDNSIKEIEDTVPRFFYDFPLFTTERFRLPVIINSLFFEPKTERDGIYLGETNTYDVQKNKAIISKSLELYLKLIDELIKKDCERIFILARIQKVYIPDIDNDWFNDELSIVITQLINKNIIRNDNNSLINLSESIIPYLLSSPCSFDKDFWLLVKKIFPDKIVSSKNHDEWISIIKEWKELKNEKFLFEKNIKDIAIIIEENKDIEQFSGKYFDKNLTDTIGWLNKFYELINNNNNNYILDEIAILPNQNNVFVKKTSELKLDKEINEELKDILKILEEDIRAVLINKEITFYNKKTIFSFKTQQEVYEHTITEIKNIEQCFEKNEFQASQMMLKWLLNNDKFEPLEGFPISTKLVEEKRNIYKLSTNQKLLAPINLWQPEVFRNYSEIFNDEFILNDVYDSILDGFVNSLEIKGFIHSKPLYEEKRKFSKEDLQKIVTEKVEENFWEENEEDSNKIEIPEILASNIAYFISPPEKSVLRNSRKSKKQTQKLLELIFNCVLLNDNNIFNEKELVIRNKNLKIYPSFWLAKLKSNQWVNVGKDKDEAPTSTNLTLYFENSNELKEKLKNENVAKLLNIIGVSVGDLTKNIYAKTDKEKLEWDKAYTSILSAGHDNAISPEEIQNIFNDETLIEEIKNKYREKQIVKNNRNIGLTIEDIFQEIVDTELSNMNIKINKVVVGRDFDIEYDFVEDGGEKLISIENKDYTYSIELKSTRTNYIRMTRAQGLLATEKQNDFALCVLQHKFNLEDFKDENGDVKNDIRNEIKSAIRFVTNIGKDIKPGVEKVLELDEKVRETKLSSTDIEVDIEEGEIKYKIHDKIWQNSLDLNLFISMIKGKF